MKTFYIITLILIALLIVATLISILISSIKSIKAFNNFMSDGSTPLFITSIDGDRLINTDEVEHIVQTYNTVEKEYQIIYYLKSGFEITEKFDNKTECEYRFYSIKEIFA